MTSYKKTEQNTESAKIGCCMGGVGETKTDSNLLFGEDRTLFACDAGVAESSSPFPHFVCDEQLVSSKRSGLRSAGLASAEQST